MEQKSGKSLYQWNFVISGLIPKQVKLKRKIWLKKGELLLDKKGDDLHVYLLGNEDSSSCDETKIAPYLWMSSLITNNATELSNGGGCSITSVDKLGTEPMFSCTISSHIPDEAVEEIEKHTYKFLSSIGKLHDKYINIINDNKFIAIALDYFHDAEKKFVFNDEGFISAMISLESLFNESGADLTYKISHRASFLLSLSGTDPIDAFENLKKFYTYRSHLVHGKEGNLQVANKDLMSIYTRKLIIIFLILLTNTERSGIGQKDMKRKKAILKEIDHAMLDIKRRKILEKEIKKGLKDFKLKIPRVFEGTGKNGDYRTTAW